MESILEKQESISIVALGDTHEGSVSALLSDDATRMIDGKKFMSINKLLIDAAIKASKGKDTIELVKYKV